MNNKYLRFDHNMNLCIDGQLFFHWRSWCSLDHLRSRCRTWSSGWTQDCGEQNECWGQKRERTTKTFWSSEIDILNEQRCIQNRKILNRNIFICGFSCYAVFLKSVMCLCGMKDVHALFDIHIKSSLAFIPLSWSKDMKINCRLSAISNGAPT